MSDVLIPRRPLRLIAVDGVRRGPITEPPSRRPSLVVPSGALDSRSVAIARAIADELFEWSSLCPETETAQRIDLSCHVGLVADGEHWVGHTENLGARGAFVASYLVRPAGAQLRALIELPTTQVIDVVATVAGHRPARDGSARSAGMQLVFGAMSGESKHGLAQLLHALSVDFWRTTA